MESKFCSDEELRDFLAKDGNHIIWAYITRYCKGLDKDDCWQECCIAVARALGMYNPASGVKKTTYVIQAIQNQIKMMIRSHTTQKQMFNREAASADDEPALHEEEYDLEESVITKIVMDSRTKALLEAIEIADLSSRERLVIRLTLRDKKQQELGKEIGLSQGQVSKLKKQAMSKIKIVLEAHNWDGISADFRDEEFLKERVACSV